MSEYPELRRIAKWVMYKMDHCIMKEIQTLLAERDKLQDLLKEVRDSIADVKEDGNIEIEDGISIMKEIYKLVGDVYETRCVNCGIFASIESNDFYIPFGCASYDPPEPHPPQILCDDCSQKKYIELIAHFRRGGRNGDYIKSNAEKDAALRCGLKWNDSKHVYEDDIEQNAG